jgi:hypothetical protein
LIGGGSNERERRGRKNRRKFNKMEWNFVLRYSTKRKREKAYGKILFLSLIRAREGSRKGRFEQEEEGVLAASLIQHGKVG